MSGTLFCRMVIKSNISTPFEYWLLNIGWKNSALGTAVLSGCLLLYSVAPSKQTSQLDASLWFQIKDMHWEKHQWPDQVGHIKTGGQKQRGLFFRKHCVMFLFNMSQRYYFFTATRSTAWLFPFPEKFGECTFPVSKSAVLGTLPATTAARAQHGKDWKEKGVKLSPSLPVVTSQLKIQINNIFVCFCFSYKKNPAKSRNYLWFCFYTELLQMLNSYHEAFDFSWNIHTLM